MSPGLTKLSLVVHLSSSVGWLGAVGAYLALDVTVATSQEELILRAAYLAMGLIASYVIVPLALASLVTGFIQALGTKWGLFRHYWVLTSLLLTILATLVLLSETRTINYFGDLASDPATSGGELRVLGNTLFHSMGAVVVLLVVMVLNVYKPRGLTPYGWRKQQEQREMSRV